VPDGKEEIYSIMFSSLKHPARRKILRVLADKPVTFSEMLELLGISSSNLTYHLENLGELISKDNKGVYRLSTFGEAAVSTMRIVEEAPQVQPKKSKTATQKWRILTGSLLIVIIVLASISVFELNTLNQTNTELNDLQKKYNQLLSWATTTDDALSFLQKVVQIDTNHYQASLLSRTVEQRDDLGGAIQEIMRYSLTSEDSKLTVVFRFRNNQLSRYQLVVTEGSPVYSQAQSHNALDAAKGVLDRFSNFEGDLYLQNMSRLLSLVTSYQSIEIKEGNLKLNATVFRDNGRIEITHTENGVDYSPKSLMMIYEDRTLVELTNGYYLFKVGDTEVNISSERAVELARNALKSFSWTADGQTVSNFGIMPEPESIQFHPNTKNSIELYPQWTITFYLDRVYPGDIYRIAVYIWADTGEIAQIQTMNA